MLSGFSGLVRLSGSPRRPLKDSAGEKPGFELPMGQDDPYADVGPDKDGALEKSGAELRRTVIVAVEEDQDAAVPAGAPRRELHGALQLSFLEKLVSPHPKRVDLNGGSGRQHVGDSSHQDRDRFEVALTLDDARQMELHSGDRAVEEAGCLSCWRSGSQLIHPQKLAGCVEMIPES
jgi:hypothetical protein